MRTATDLGGPRPGTITNHYDGTADSPAWILEHDGAWTRYLAGLAGDLAATQRSDGTAELALTNLHGDIVAAAAPDDTAALGVSAYFEQTEYGLPRAENASNPIRYGWLGGKQRSTDTLAGLILMGVRLYNPATGMFLSVDPIPGGNATAYSYCSGDPINKFDLDGRCWQVWQKRCRGKNSGWNAAGAVFNTASAFFGGSAIRYARRVWDKRKSIVRFARSAWDKGISVSPHGVQRLVALRSEPTV